MRSFSLRAGLPAAVLALIVAPPSPAQKLTKAEISERGKAATALVEVKANRATGTAFCVHGDGLFITNEHVIRGAGASEIDVVLDPSLKTQRVLRAKVVRADQALDLALLRADGATGLVRLPLASGERVTELMDVFAFGFPFGRLLAPDVKEYPAVSVNAGTVTALRRKAGELDRIQLDVALNPGNSGGPVLDETGHVVGVVVAGVTGGARVNLAIPVSHLARFLAAPEIRFVPPPLPLEKLTAPVEFTARAVAVAPGAREPDLRLVLRAGDEVAREFPMRKRDGAFVVTAAPAAAPVDRRVTVTARFDSGIVSGLSENAVFKVGGQPMRLAGVRRIEFKPKPLAVLADGKTLTGAISGLETVEIDVGGQQVRLDLSRAVQGQVQPAVGIAAVTATVIATVGGQEVGRIEVQIPVGGAQAVSRPVEVAIQPPALAADKVVKRLPEPFSDVILGGGGRYLIFFLPRLHKLAVFDVTEARVTNYVPLAEDKVAFAAGLDKLVIGLSQKGALERWSLTTNECETTAYPPLREKIKTVFMGYASNGPVVVNGTFMDLDTLRPLPVTYPPGRESAWGTSPRIYPSGEGTVFGSWNTNYSPGTATTFVLEGGEVKRYDEGEMGHVIPGPDGRTVFTAKGHATSRMKYADPEDAKLGWCLPATHGSYFVSLTPGEKGKGGDVAMYLLGQVRPLARPEGLKHGLSFDGWDREDFGAWKRFFFIPQANVIVVLPPGNDQLVLYKFDVEAALEQSGLEYLLITSQPPRVAVRGMTYSYQVAVKAKHSGVSYRLDAGPKGMEVSKAGLVKWPVPAEAPEGEHEVILTVQDGKGQEIFHTFTVRVPK